MTVIKPVLIRSGSLELHFYIDSVEQQLLKDINELQHGYIKVKLKTLINVIVIVNVINICPAYW